MELIQEWAWLGLVLVGVIAGRWFAQRKANRIRNEGRQEASAALMARMQTGSQHVVVDASDRRRVAFGTADLGTELDVELHHGAVPGELGPGLQRSLGGDHGRDSLGHAAVVRPAVHGGEPRRALPPPVAGTSMEDYYDRLGAGRAAGRARQAWWGDE